MCRSAAGFRSRVKGFGRVMVEQRRRKTTGLRGDYGALQMQQALIPARSEAIPPDHHRCRTHAGRGRIKAGVLVADLVLDGHEYDLAQAATFTLDEWQDFYDISHLTPDQLEDMEGQFHPGATKAMLVLTILRARTRRDETGSVGTGRPADDGGPGRAHGRRRRGRCRPSYRVTERDRRSPTAFLATLGRMVRLPTRNLSCQTSLDSQSRPPVRPPTRRHRRNDGGAAGGMHGSPGRDRPWLENSRSRSSATPALCAGR